MLRFLAMKNYRTSFKHDVGDFLTEYMEQVSDPDEPLTFDFPAEQTNFERTFAVLSLGSGRTGVHICKQSAKRAYAWF